MADSAVQIRPRDTQRLQRSLADLLAVSALPAAWKDRSPHHIVSTLLASVLDRLELEFVGLRLERTFDDVPRETVCVQPQVDASLAPLLWQALDRWIAVPGSTPAARIVPNPMGDGQIAVTFVRLGVQEDRGMLVVGARRQHFPEPAETLLLQVAVNQMVIALDEAERAAERRKEARRLEQHGAGRSAQRAESAGLEPETLADERGARDRLLLSWLVENSTDFIGLASMRGEVWYLNAAAQQLVGLRGDAQVQGSLISDYVGPNDRWKLERQIIPTLESCGRWEGEVTFRHFMTGADLPMHTHAFIVKARDGNEPIGLATISRSITRRKREERELLVLKDELASELAAMTHLHELSTRLLAKAELSAHLSEVLVATMALQNADFGNVQLMNPVLGTLEIVAQLGFSREFLDHFRAADENAACGRSIASGARVIIEDVLTDESFAPHRAIAASAGFRAVQSTPLFDANGRSLGVISTHFRKPHRPSPRDLRFTDMYARLAALTIERQRAQTALRRSEFHLAEAQRIGHVGSWVFNTVTGDMLWSDELQRILGLTCKARPSHDLFLNAVHTEERALVRERFDLALAQRGTFDEQFRLALADGSVRYVHAFGVPVPNDTDNVLEYVGTVVDITQRKLADETARRAENDLARVGRAVTMGELTASIAHELNQPLAAVATNAAACVRWLAADPANVGEADAVLAASSPTRTAPAP